MFNTFMDYLSVLRLANYIKAIRLKYFYCCFYMFLTLLIVVTCVIALDELLLALFSWRLFVTDMQNRMT